MEMMAQSLDNPQAPNETDGNDDKLELVADFKVSVTTALRSTRLADGRCAQDEVDHNYDSNATTADTFFITERAELQLREG